MAVRIRKNGKILCARMFLKRKGDIYINDNLHYYLSVTKKLLVTEPFKKHKQKGQWWWKSEVPKNIIIDAFYIERS